MSRGPGVLDRRAARLLHYLEGFTAWRHSGKGPADDERPHGARAGLAGRAARAKTCLAMISETGTYKIAGGTGSYAGISGSGNYQLSVLFLGPKSKGKCATTGALLAQHQLLQISGRVSM